MTRVTRTRSRSLSFAAGSLDGVSGGVPFTFNNDGISYSSVCQDSHGRPTVDSPLNITVVNKTFPVFINGNYNSGPSYHAVATNYIPHYIRDGAFGFLDLPSRPSASSQMTTLLARTNPSRPDYVPLSLLQDLRDIPKMLKDVGKLLKTPKRLLSAKEIANQNLLAQFGVAPLIQDVKDLLDLQGHIHKRVDELQRLYKSGGLKRRIHLGRWSNGSQSTKTVESSLTCFISMQESVFVKSDRWGTVRWLPSVTLPSNRPSDAEIIRKAKQVALGLSVESTLKGAWDLVPWSFVIDWFSNVSDFALQYSNTVPARPSGACVMTRTEWYTQFSKPVQSIGSYTVSDGSVTNTVKERYVGPGTLDVHLPFIGLSRLSIIGSLFIQRFHR